MWNHCYEGLNIFLFLLNKTKLVKHFYFRSKIYHIVKRRVINEKSTTHRFAGNGYGWVYR